MTQPRTSNTELSRAIGRIEGQMDGITTAVASQSASVSTLAESVIALRADLRDIKTQLEPVVKQTKWLEEKRAQGVGFIAAASIAFAVIASAAGAIGGQVWRVITGGEA
jgi:septal ring factor EnvC (AmiA/AmiB activator)